MTSADAPASELWRSTATQLARAIAGGELSAVEVVEAHIARIEAVDPALNAVVVKRFAQARAEAAEADARRARGDALGALHGVPITVKECLDLAGTPSTFGLAARKNSVAAADDPYVARLRAAGAIVLGKTNVAQLLMSFESNNPVYGRTNNPWNPARAPGGSSGGEGAIVAAPGSGPGGGTDIGGSGRIPAAFCGIASLKPTAGRAPDAGRASVPIGERAIVSQVGILARCVDDVALGIALINGSREAELVPDVPLGDYRGVDVASLRIAVYEDDGVFTPGPGVRRAVREAAAALGAAGARVTPWQPPQPEVAIDLFFGLLSGDRGRSFAALVRGEKVDPNIAPLIMMGQRSRPALTAIRALLRAAGQAQTADKLRAFGYADSNHHWQLAEAQLDYRTRFLDALDRAEGGPFDLVLAAPCALPAYTHGAFRDLAIVGSYSVLANLLGFPAGVVP